MSKNHRQVIDTGLRSSCVLDRLEPEGQVINENEESASQTQSEEASCNDATSPEYSGWNRCEVTLPNLNNDESDEKNPGHDKKSDDSTIVPRILLPSPLQSQQQADDCRQEEEVANRIELSEPSHEADRPLFLSLRGFEENDYGKNGHGTNWKAKSRC